MLVRQKHIEAFKRSAQERYVILLSRQLRRHFATEHERLGEEAFRELIRDGIARAMVHGYATARTAAYYISLMLMLGRDFDRDPQLPWMKELLDDRDVEDPLERIERAWGAAMVYFDETAGAENQQLAKALLRILDYDFRSLDPPDGNAFTVFVQVGLRRLYPQKYNYQGEAATRALIELGLPLAERHGLATPSGRAVIITLMFMLGSGFDRDRQFPWAHRILADPEISEPVKVDRLYRRSIAFVNAALVSE